MTWKQFINISLISVLCTLNSALSFAGFFVGPGGTAASFLKVPLSARPAALAGAFTGVNEDVATLDYNPAGLDRLAKRDVNLSLIDYVEDASLQSLSVGMPIRTTYTDSVWQKSPNTYRDLFFFGLQYKAFTADDEERSITGQKQGEFQVRDELLQMTLATSLAKFTSLGASLKLISQKIKNDSATTYAFDVGSLWYLTNRLTLGASILNVGPDVKLIDEGDPLPLQFRTGVSVDLNQFLILGDISMGRDKILQPAVSTEWSPASLIKVRLGSLYHKTWEVTGGLGLNLTPKQKRKPFDSMTKPSARFGPFDFGLDYAIQTRNELGVNHTVTFKLGF